MAADGYMQKVIAVALFCAVGPSLIFLNKHLISTLNFKYPMFISGLGVVASAVFSRLIIMSGAVKLQHGNTVTWDFYARKILPVGFCMSATLYFGNVAYIYLSVAFLQMMKAFAPVICMLMLFAFGLEKPSILLIAAIVIIAIGTAVAGYGELHFSVIGVAYLLTSETCEAFKLVVQQMVLDNMKFPVVEGLYFMAPAASVFLILGVAVLEWEQMVADGAMATIYQNPGSFGAAALLGFGVNFAGFLVIKLLGSLSMKVSRAPSAASSP
jgi:drug/metabolite transporter (DMT)-like permease